MAEDSDTRGSREHAFLFLCLSNACGLPKKSSIHRLVRHERYRKHCYGSSNLGRACELRKPALTNLNLLPHSELVCRHLKCEMLRLGFRCSSRSGFGGI